MKLYGIKNSDELSIHFEFPEVTVLARIEEIDELIEFLKFVKNDHGEQCDKYHLPKTHNHFIF